MAQAFYNRFLKIGKTEAFSTDVVFTQFSKTDTDYTGADCVANPSSYCDPSDDTTVGACKCLYKEKVDQLGEYANSEKRSQKSLDDGDEEYSARAIDILNISIGISIMLVSIYYMNE
jgi:hypothetical protein